MPETSAWTGAGKAKDEAETGRDAFEWRCFYVTSGFQKNTNCGYEAEVGVVIVFNRLTIVCREGINITGKCVSPFREK